MHILYHHLNEGNRASRADGGQVYFGSKSHNSRKPLLRTEKVDSGLLQMLQWKQTLSAHGGFFFPLSLDSVVTLVSDHNDLKSRKKDITFTFSVSFKCFLASSRKAHICYLGMRVGCRIHLYRLSYWEGWLLPCEFFTCTLQMFGGAPKFLSRRICKLLGPAPQTAFTGWVVSTASWI